MKPLDAKSLAGILICPECHGNLRAEGPRLVCTESGHSFHPNSHGYVEFRVTGEGDDQVYDQDTTPEDYARTQEYCGLRQFNAYLRHIVYAEPFDRVLDAGCGMAVGITKMLEDGREAYGVDLPNLSGFWASAGRDPQHFFCCDASRLPFRDGYFDVVYSLGVIEHIGTKIGYFTLRDDWLEMRQQFADELLRVTRPGGRIIVACPNKHFPIDIQHPPRDVVGPETALVRFRMRLYGKTGMNLHPVWGRHHLLSYKEIRQHFCEKGGASSSTALPLKGYFGFSKFERSSLGPLLNLVKFYMDNLPGFLRESFLNPYMLAQIRK